MEGHESDDGAENAPDSATGAPDAPRAVICVPMAPGPELSANYHGHWRRQRRAARELREVAYLAARAALDDPSTGAHAFRGRVQPVELSAVIAWDDPRRLRTDPTNLPHLLKAVIDGISDGLWFGQDRHVRLGRVEQERGAGEVRVVLRAVRAIAGPVSGAGEENAG